MRVRRPLKRTRLLAFLSVAVFVMSVAAAPRSATAQVWLEWSVGTFSRPVMTSRLLKEMAESVGMSLEQRRASEELLSAYEAEHAALIARAEEIRAHLDTDSFEGLPENGLWYRQSFTLRRDLFNRVGALSEGLWRDIKAIAASNQIPKLDAWERRLRRERLLRVAEWRGTNIPDLSALIQAVRPESSVMSAITPSLQAYETDLDRELDDFESRRSKYLADWERIIDTYVGDSSQAPQSIKDAARELQRSGFRLDALRRRHLDQIQAAVPAEHRSAFDDRIHRRLFPGVFKASRTSRYLSTALTLKSFDETAIAAIKDLNESYERDSAAALRRWLDLLVAQQRAVCAEQDASQLSRDANAAEWAKKELDKKTLERLYAILGVERTKELQTLIQRRDVDLSTPAAPKPE